MTWVEDRHAIVGLPDQDPIGLPGVVAVLPDDWVASPKYRGTMADVSTAGGAGLRSEILFGLLNQSDTIGLRLWNLWVASTTGGASVEVVTTIAAANFTQKGFRGHDLRLDGTAGAAQFTKNTAAATSRLGEFLVREVICVTANVWVFVPGFDVFMIGSQDPRSIIVRPTGDNVGVRAMCAWQILEKRKL